VPADRERLYAAIADRFAAMMAAGFLSEVTELHARGDLHVRMPSMRSVGYRQLWQYLDGLSSFDQAMNQAVVATRHLARRQLVWLRAETEIEWIDALDSDAPDTMEHAVALLCDDAKNAI